MADSGKPRESRHKHLTSQRDGLPPTVNYYSKYPGELYLLSMTFTVVIAVIKSVFAGHGIPEIYVSAKRSLFSSAEFHAASEMYDFTHITSSPRHTKSNGEVEPMVHMVKECFKKSENWTLALLFYNAPGVTGLNPA